MNNNYNSTNGNLQNYNNINNKNNNLGLIIIILIIIGGCIFGYFKFIKPSGDNRPDSNQQTNDTENKNNENTSNTTIGIVDPNTNLTYDKTGAFLMTIEDVFSITGKGTVATGEINRGTVRVNDTVQLLGLNNEIITTTVKLIERSGKEIDTAEIGDNVGIFLKNVSKDEVKRGQVLAQPNSIVAATKFEADVYILTKGEGGRSTPISNNNVLPFYFLGDVDGNVNLPNGVEMVNPGDNIKLTINLVSPVAMEKGTEFLIRDNGKTIGKGTVTKVY